jgi:NADH-quinone oxidoreductase subunit E
MTVRRLAEVQPESFEFTPENLAWAKAQIAKYPPGRQASAVIPLLWKAQAQNDYWLPRPAIEKVAQMLDMPAIRVMEVATFYSMFNLEPVGRHFVQLCGTTPCMLRGANDLKDVLRKRIGAERMVSADGHFAWLEVECLGACCNAPMVQINDDYYEDLTAQSLEKLLDDLAAGRPVNTGSQTGRVSSEPEPGRGTTLTDPALYDGSVVGAWRARFEEERRAAAAEAEAKAASSPPPTVAAKPAAPAAAPVSTQAASGPKEAREAADKAGLSPGQPGAPKTAEASGSPGSPTGVAGKVTGAEIAAAEGPAAEAEARARQEEAEIAAKLSTLPADASPEAKADAVGARPQPLSGARDGRADDLTKIKGIGPVNEGKLHQLGVYHFDQIANWTVAEARWVGVYLAFPGRIARENWIGQARSLAAERK